MTREANLTAVEHNAAHVGKPAVHDNLSAYRGGQREHTASTLTAEQQKMLQECKVHPHLPNCSLVGTDTGNPARHSAVHVPNPVDARMVGQLLAHISPVVDAGMAAGQLAARIVSGSAANKDSTREAPKKPTNRA